WELTTVDGETCRSRIVLACGARFVPWIPDLPGHNDFGGPTFHAAAPDPDFDPVGKHVAVIGSDAAAGRFIELMAASAASVEVFPHPPRRVIRRTRRWPRRDPSADVVTSGIDTLTASGIRTCDGAHHDADAIIYGTGLAIADRDETLAGTGGLRIQQAWRDGMEPYLGIAVHGFPNYFFVAGPDTETAARNIALCLQLMTRAGTSRIDLRRSTQHVFNERVHLRRPRRRPAASAFDLSSATAMRDDTYDGTATLTVDDTPRQVRVRLTGHVDPIDGQYHWQGTVFGEFLADVLKQTRAVRLAVGECSAPARITELTPQGTHAIAGVGAPPFTPADVELTVPQL
ncbi:MAG: DUF4873 domain-containing protein, partial [Mycobacterium sp.]